MNKKQQLTLRSNAKALSREESAKSEKEQRRLVVETAEIKGPPDPLEILIYDLSNGLPDYIAVVTYLQQHPNITLDPDVNSLFTLDDGANTENCWENIIFHIQNMVLVNLGSVGYKVFRATRKGVVVKSRLLRF